MRRRYDDNVEVMREITMIDARPQLSQLTKENLTIMNNTFYNAEPETTTYNTIFVY